MRLRRFRRPTEPLEARRLFALEAATASAAFADDAELAIQSASAAALPNGATLVAFADQDTLTGKGKDVFLRTLNAAGTPTGSATTFNVTTGGSQMNPDVAANAGGRYVAAWQSENVDGSGWAIVARVFDGTTTSAEITVNQTTAGNQTFPKVGIDSGGRFVVAWYAPDSGNGEVFARRFNADGTPASGEFKVNGSSSLATQSPALAVLPSGAFGVGFVRLNTATDSNADVLARFYDASGNGTAAEPVAVSVANAAGDQAEPALAAAGSRYVVAYSDNAAGDATVHARAFTVAGVAEAAAFQVSQDSDGNRSRVRVAADAAGTVAIAWTQQVAGAPSAATVVRYYDASLAATGNEHATTDEQTARTLQDLVVVGPGQIREVATLGEVVGAGVGATAGLRNAVRIDGTPGDDRAEVSVQDNVVTLDYANAMSSFPLNTIAAVSASLGDGDDALVLTDVAIALPVFANGEAGDDSIFCGLGNDSVAGGDGKDLIELGGGSDYAIGNDDADRLFGHGGDDTLTGGGGKDTMYGGDGADRLAGSASPDVLLGEDGDDRVYGEDGDDRLDGGGGKDRVYGGVGNDYLAGGSSNDRLYGDAGNDSLGGGKANDYLDGGDGSDLVLGREPGDTLISIEAP